MGKNQNPKKFLGVPAKPKNPWGWGWGEGHGPTLDGAKFSERSYPHFKTSLTQTMSNALKHSPL